jgi:hypothetical protein
MTENAPGSKERSTLTLLADTSTIVSRAVDSMDALRVIAKTFLEHLGLDAIEISTEEDDCHSMLVTSGHSQRPGEPRLLSAPIVAAGKEIGLLAFYARSHNQAEEWLGIAAFAGQQIGILLTLARLRGENRRLKSEISISKREIEERKKIGRARGILAERQQVSERRALQMLQQRSVKLGKPIAEVAQAVIDFHAGNGFQTRRRTA